MTHSKPLRIIRKRTRYYIIGKNFEAGWWGSRKSATTALSKVRRSK